MSVLYADNGKIYSHEYIELYIPKDYFTDNSALNNGATIQTLGVIYCRTFSNGNPNEFKMFNLPVSTELYVYETHYETIKVRTKTFDTLCLEYLPDTEILHQSLPKGREIANNFLDLILKGKLPHTLYYPKTIDLWWKNLEMSGISYKVPSKIFEMILASIYRNPHNMKQRYGQLYGRQDNPNGYDYTTGNVREIVKNLSSFSGLVFEDIGAMISSAIVNSLHEVDEPISPLEKIIHY